MTEGRRLIKELGLESVLKEVNTLKKQMPNGDITSDDAMLYEIKCWHMKSKLTDALTTARQFEEDSKQERDNTLVDIGGEEDAPKSEAGKERYAKADERWRKLQKKAKQAQVLREYIENKRTDFEQAVYVMRSQASNRLKDKESMPKET